MLIELTHIPISPRTRNVLLAVVAGLILLLFWKAPTLPQLLISGMAVALVLSFPVRFLSRAIPRGIAIAVVMLALLAILVVATIVLVPLAVGQLVSLAEQAPRLLDEAYAWARRVVVNLVEYGILDTSPDEVMVELQRNGAARAEVAAGRGSSPGPLTPSPAQSAASSPRSASSSSPPTSWRTASASRPARSASSPCSTATTRWCSGPTWSTPFPAI